MRFLSTESLFRVSGIKALALLFHIGELILPAVKAQVSFGTVIGIDLGTQHVKVAYLDTQAQDPLAIMLNDLSERKTQNAVAFRNDQVFIGSHVSKPSMSLPERAYYWINKFLGQSYDNPLIKRELEYTAAELVPDSRNKVAARTNGNEVAPIEYLTALLLSKIVQHTEEHSGKPVSAAVITVPSTFGQSQRQAVLDAAKIAGLTVLGLNSDMASAATFYGLFAAPSNAPHYAVMIDSGASQTAAALVFIDPTYQESNKNMTLVEVKRIYTDFSVAGLEIDRAVAKILGRKFAEANKGLQVPPGRALNRLMVDSAKAKHILSANQETRVNIDSLVDDRNLVATINRQELEDECAYMKGKSAELIERLLADAGVKLDDVAQIVSIGGNSRVPFIQNELKTKFGSKMAYTLNMDETVAKGAAWNAAVLARKNVRKASRIHDSYPFSVSLSYRGVVEDVAADMKTIPLYAKHSSVDGHKGVSFKNMDSVSFSVIAENQGPIFDASITGAKSAYLKFADKAVLSNKLKFWVDLNPSGIIEIKDIPVALVEYEVQQPKVKNETVATNTTTTEIPNEELETVQKTETIPLEITLKDAYAPLSPEVIKTFHDKIVKAKHEEHLAALKSAARNSLESNVYRLNDLIEAENFTANFQDAERERLLEEIRKAHNLLDEDENTLERATFEAALKSLLEPEAFVNSRIEEHGKVKKSLESLRKAIGEVEDYIYDLRQDHPTEATRGPTDEDLFGLAELAKDAEKWRDGVIKQFATITLKMDPPVKSTEIDGKVTELSLKKALLLLKKAPTPVVQTEVPMENTAEPQAESPTETPSTEEVTSDKMEL